MDLVQMKAGEAAAVGLLGYAVVFAGLVILMCVIMLMSRQFMTKAEAPGKDSVPAEPVAAVTASGTAGELKLYDTDPKDAAMIMAIVAEELKTPLNELRFISIREVKES